MKEIRSKSMMRLFDYGSLKRASRIRSGRKGLIENGASENIVSVR